MARSCSLIVLQNRPGTLYLSKSRLREPLGAAAVFAVERALVNSLGTLRADFSRAHPIDPCAKYHQGDAGYRCAALRPQHRPYHASNHGNH